MPPNINPDDPQYIFNAPLESFDFFGEDAAEKARNASQFTTLRGIGQRFWQQYTKDELEAIKLAMRTCIVEA